MASAILKRVSASAKSTLVESMRIRASSRAFAAVAVGTDIVSAAPNVSLQKARSWDEGVSSKFSTTPLKDIFEVFSSIVRVFLSRLIVLVFEVYLCFLCKNIGCS